MSGQPKIVPLRQPKGTDNVAATLRVIADEIDSGKYSEWPITTAVLICGHESERPDGDGTVVRTAWHTHGFGPRNGAFACRGLLASVLAGTFDSDPE